MPFGRGSCSCPPARPVLSHLLVLAFLASGHQGLHPLHRGRLLLGAAGAQGGALAVRRRPPARPVMLLWWPTWRAAAAPAPCRRCCRCCRCCRRHCRAAPLPPAAAAVPDCPSALLRSTHPPWPWPLPHKQAARHLVAPRRHLPAAANPAEAPLSGHLHVLREAPPACRCVLLGGAGTSAVLGCLPHLLRAGPPPCCPAPRRAPPPP